MKIKSIILLVACVLLSVISLLSVAVFSNFKIGEYDGIIYQNIITPIFGAIYFAIFFIIFRIKNSLLITSVLLFQIVIFSAFHHYVINFYGIGGDYYLDVDEEYKTSSIDELFAQLQSRNTSKSWGAWEKLKKIEAEKEYTLMNYIKYRRSENPKYYIDEVFVEKAIEYYAKRKDIKVKVYLYEMLESDFYNEVIENGKLYHYYATRKWGKKLLQKYFDEDIDIVYRLEINK